MFCKPKPPHMKRLFFFFLATLCYVSAFSQQTDQAASDTLRKDALNVFMDASNYIKKEIPYINYVRDIKDAGVYIISTYEMVGSGGIKYTYFFVGQHEFEGMKDTLSWSSSPDDTEETTRISQVKILKMGLMRYVAKTPIAKFINVSFTKPLSETVSTDKWDSWVFRTSLNTYLNGQETTSEMSVGGNMSANRVTKDWKINLSGSIRYSKAKYEYTDTTITSIRNNKYFNSLIVKSISDHWSVGGSVNLSSSKYSNYKYMVSALPGIEYDVFPYSQSTRRQLRLLYTVGLTYAHYNDTSQYFKIKELLPVHNLSASLEVIEKWGTVNTSMSYSNYLQYWSQNNLSFDAMLELRIAKGLNFNLYGSVSFVHNQRNLPKGDATLEEILTYQRELKTTYYFYTSFGFTYTFGSIYNNVVNPRFGGGGGGGYVIMY